MREKICNVKIKTLEIIEMSTSMNEAKETKIEETIEDIILRHSKRGMDKLWSYLRFDFCKFAAEAIWNWERGTVFLVTGFYVAGHQESDGPCGTLCLAKALQSIGFHCVIITDNYCRQYFEPMGFEVIYWAMDADDKICQQFLKKYQPVGLIAVERCGVNFDGIYTNMCNQDIGAYVAPIDRLFELVFDKIPTIGIGDGGNEIGMGNVAEEIHQVLQLTPCRVRTSYLIIATVSNWGVFGLLAYLQQYSQVLVLPTWDQVESYYRLGKQLGHVDGATRKCSILTVDGIQRDLEQQILYELHEISAV